MPQFRSQPRSQPRPQPWLRPVGPRHARRRRGGHARQRRPRSTAYRLLALTVALLSVLSMSSFPQVRDRRAYVLADRSATTGIAIPGTTLLYDSSEALDAYLDGVVAAGVQWLRFDAPWTQIETAPGVRDWSNLDRVVTRAAERGLSIDLVLGTVAEWARPAGTDWRQGASTTEQRDGFAVFGAAVAERYADRVVAYEVWNEPNLPGSWAPQPNAADYLQLLRQTYAAVRAADPEAVVVSGGTGGGSTGIASLLWYESLYRAGLKDVCDAVAVHPYPDAPVLLSGEMAQALEIRALMTANGDGDKALWGTEVGVPTGGTPSVDETVQATMVTGLHDVWATVPNRGPLMYYTLQDTGGTDREGYFGLLRPDGSEKPAYSALRTLTDS
ncbi:MAG TPA: cellulase family glycosylhydrolase [Actinoplanes sp.]